MEFKYAIENGVLINRDNMTNTQGTKVLYEVIKVIKGKALFAQDHLRRLSQSAQLSNMALERSLEDICKDIERLTEEEKISQCNIRIEMAYGEKIGGVTQVFFIDSFYPTPAMYDQGVATVFYKISRDNPNIKLHNQAFKDEVAQIKGQTYFEVILVDDDFDLSEGSRSNLFFVKGNTLITAKGKDVLKGITRDKVFEAIEACGYTLEEKVINVLEVNNFDGAFITGTSLGVLPLSCISEHGFKSSDNPVIKNLSHYYEQLVVKDIEESGGCNE